MQVMAECRRIYIYTTRRNVNGVYHKQNANDAAPSTIVKKITMFMSELF